MGSTLTKKERDALEEVFLSINSSSPIKEKIKSFFEKSIFLEKNTLQNQKNVVNRDIYTIFFHFFIKVKKNLSKLILKYPK